MAITANKSLNIAVSAFGDTSQLIDWLNESAWIFPALILNIDTVEMLRIHADRLVRLRKSALEGFEICASAFLERSKELAAEVDHLRAGMAALDAAASIASPKAASPEDSNPALREALWEALEIEALALDPVRKALDKEVSSFLKDLDPVASDRINQAQTLLEEALSEAPLERSRLIRESRRCLREITGLDGANLDPIFLAEVGWMDWQANAGERESLQWFAEVLQDVGGQKGFGLAIAIRLYAYFLAKVESFAEAYRWARVAADLWPCTGTFHERAQYAMKGATREVAKREVTAFIKKSPLASLIAFADPDISELGPELVEICIKRQQKLRQNAQISTGEWELAAHNVTAVLSLLPGIQIANELLEGPAIAKTGLERADFLTASQTLVRSTEGKASLLRSANAGIQKEKRKRTEALMVARQTVDALMQERDDLLKTSTETHDEQIGAARAALVEAEDNSKAQRGCGMGMGGGCAIIVAYMLVSFLFSGKGMSLGPGTPIGMMCIGTSLLPLAASVIYYIGCMSRRMLLESKLSAQMAEAQRIYDLARNEANSKFRHQLESARARVVQEEQLLQHAEVVGKQFS